MRTQKVNYESEHKIGKMKFKLINLYEDFVMLGKSGAKTQEDRKFQGKKISRGLIQKSRCFNC